MNERISRVFEEHARLQRDFLKANAAVLARVCEICVEAFRKGHKLLLFGNGGSAADAQHIAGEFVNRFRADRRALPAIALTTDLAVLTSIANDSGYERVFARQIEALGRSDDVAIGFSTSGTSPNVIEGIRTARRQGLVTVGFAGRDGGALLREAEYCIVAATAVTARAQEMHMLAAHALCEVVEQEMLHPERETR
jgi:D-sedoheptulose 7-phosphate isomerase